MVVKVLMAVLVNMVVMLVFVVVILVVIMVVVMWVLVVMMVVIRDVVVMVMMVVLMLLLMMVVLMLVMMLMMMMMLDMTDLLLAGLQQKTHKVSVVVGREVRQPGAGVGVQCDLLSSLHIVNHVGPGHAVLVVVLVVLVKHGCNLLIIDSDRQQSLLIVMSCQMELEHIGPP